MTSPPVLPSEALWLVLTCVLSPPRVPPPAFPHSPAPQSLVVADPCSNTLFYIGALRLPLDGTTQEITETDFYYSGIYVEDSGPTTAL